MSGESIAIVVLGVVVVALLLTLAAARDRIDKASNEGERRFQAALRMAKDFLLKERDNDS